MPRIIGIDIPENKRLEISLDLSLWNRSTIIQ